MCAAASPSGPTQSSGIPQGMQAPSSC
jgi:hypothetical protein